MFDQQVIAFTIVAGLITLTPGVDTMLVVRNVLRGTRRDGVVTTLGICTGLFVHVILSALGLSVILMHSAVAFQVVKLAGACYLVWLGLQSLRRAISGTYFPATPDSHVNTETVSTQRCFLEGFLSDMLNPKVVVFYLAFLPQFIGPNDPVLPKSLLLASIHYTEAVAWLIVVSVMVDQTRRFFVKSAMRRWLDGLCGSILIGLGLRLAFEQR